MANQLTIRIDADDGIAVVSRSAVARSRALAVAAAAGSQVLAVTAAAQNGDESGGDTVPILVPEQVAVIALAAAVGGLVGAVVGVKLTRQSGGKKKDDE